MLTLFPDLIGPDYVVTARKKRKDGEKKLVTDSAFYDELIVKM